MKNAIWGLGLGVFVLCWEFPTGAKSIQSGGKPSLQSGELIRLDAKIGEVKGGYSYLYVKKAQFRTAGTQVHATLKARTNSFFDKIHRVNNRFTSQFRLEDVSPFTYQLNVDQAGNRFTREIAFQPNGPRSQLSLNIHYQTLYGKPYVRRYQQRLEVPANTHNLVSAFYHARFLPYKPGRTFSLYVFVTGQLWYIEGKLQRVDRLYTILGARRALMIQAWARLHRSTTKRAIQAWFTDDNERIPLKIQGYVPYLGTASAELSGYRRSSQSRYQDGAQRGKRKQGGGLWDLISEF